MRPRDQRAMARRLLPTLIVAIIVAACGGAAATPTPAPTPVATATPAPTPSPSAADVSAAFVKAITAPDYAAAAEIRGAISIAGTDGTLGGDALMIDDSSQSNTIITIAGTTESTESIEQSEKSPGGAKTWTRQNQGPWVEREPKGEPSLFETIEALSGIEDVGIVMKDGKPLHHLQAKGGNEISPEALGFDIKGATDPSFTLDLYATEDGTPAIIAVNGSWTQDSGGTQVPVGVDVEYVLSEPSASASIVPPLDPWTLFTSKPFKYEMAHPAEWTVEATKTQDSYLLDGQPYVFVAPEPRAATMTTAQFATALKKTYKPQFGAPTSETDTRLGGQAAKRLIFEFKNETGQAVTLVDDVTVRDGTGWEVFVATTGGREDIPIFDQFVSTFAFTD
jgi:hypothetical protein